MEVILVKDVDTLGESGNLVNVSDGYARNYLFPRSLAILSTTGAREDLKRRAAKIEEKNKKKHEADLKVAQTIESVGVLSLQARAGEQGKLFGAVTTKELASLISEKSGVTVDRKILKLSQPINRLGEYDVEIKLSQRVTAKLSIQVISDTDED
jgi:large subunit ribosomal protein L9